MYVPAGKSCPFTTNGKGIVAFSRVDVLALAVPPTHSRIPLAASRAFLMIVRMTFSFRACCVTNLASSIGIGRWPG